MTRPPKQTSKDASHPVDIEPTLLLERDDVWVFEKPAGFAVHPTHDPSIPDLITWIEHAGLADRPMAPIHRLDRETSGLVLCSPCADIRGQMGAWFAQGQVHKEYATLVFGETPEHATITKPLFDRRRKKTLQATTVYERLESLVGFSHLRVCPQTGRKHQIRRHLQMMGHAIVGDTRYRSKRFRKVPAFPGRLWLHAQRLELPNGWVFESSLPSALAHQLERLRAFASEEHSSS